MSTDYRFAFDATTFRVKSRITAALPDPAKGLSKLIIGDAPGGASAAGAEAGSTRTGGHRDRRGADAGAAR
jgi:hypothetical protein